MQQGGSSCESKRDVTGARSSEVSICISSPQWRVGGGLWWVLGAMLRPFRRSSTSESAGAVSKSMRDSRKVGVVTPTLNAERYLRRTLESIWAQQDELIEIEHLIVDGLSTDRTLEIASEFPSRVIQARDGGMYEALNRGLDQIEGEIVGYINADDEIAPGALRHVVEAFDARSDTQWVCGRLEYIDGEDRPLGGWTPVRMSVRSYAGLGWSCVPQQTVWARMAFLERVGLFDTTFKNCGDYDWYVRAMKVSPPMILPQLLGRFRLHQDNLSFDVDRMNREARAVQEKHGYADAGSRLLGRLLSLRLNARNPAWFVAKKTGRISFAPRAD